MTTLNTIEMDLNNVLKRMEELGKDVHMIQTELHSLQEQNKPDFKVGQWVYWYYYGRSSVLRVICITESMGFLWYYNEEEHTERNVQEENCRLATNDEIKDHLILVAKSKGFKGGLKLCPVNNNCSNSILVRDVDEWVYYSEIDRFQLNGTGIYEKGRWAEIISDKKKLPKTKEELHDVIRTWYNSNYAHDEISTFLKDYED